MVARTVALLIVTLINNNKQFINNKKNNVKITYYDLNSLIVNVARRKI